MVNTYCFADHTVQIDSIYPLVHRACRDYREDGCQAEFTIRITRKDIRAEEEKNIRMFAREGVTPELHSDPQLEFQAVLRRLAETLLPYDILLMHGSVVAVDGEAYLFTARSGVGKTTHTLLWMNRFRERAVVVNGDKPLLHVGKDGVTVYGTPWDGKERMSRNMSCPLKAICILTRSEDNFIEPITKREAFPTLLQQIYRPDDPIAMAGVLTLADRLGSGVALYRLGCNMEPEAAEVSYGGMNTKTQTTEEGG